MRTARAHGRESESGQASVEFLGTLPAALLLALVAWQLVLAGHTAWLAANAARVAARAQAVGRDPDAAARSALPSYLERGLRVRPAPGLARGAAVGVRVQVPLLLHRWESPVSVAARAALERQVQGP